MSDEYDDTAPLAPEAADKAVDPVSDHEPAWVRFLERGETIMLLGGIGSLVFSFLALGVLPLIELRDEVTRSTPEQFTAMTAKEEQGFTVYKREGCAYCHTTFVRDTPSDVRRWGPPAEAWEYQDQYPQQWGTRRIGPDLSRESGLRSDGWQYAHLYNPRSTVPQSVMPGYPWLFSEAPDGTVVPNEDAEALVTYLNYLGRDIKVSGPQTERGKNAMNGDAGSGHGGM